MSVKMQVNGQMKVVADVIVPGVIAKIGAIWKIYSGSDWIQCDGTAISRTIYSDLFAAIGTTFGSGDGVNTFNIPTQSQANRITFSVTTNQTFSQFTSDADVVVNNPAAAYIDISNGAAGPGIRISIIEQSNQGVTIYTDAAHTQSCLLLKGIIILEWDGTSWVCISARTSMKQTFTSGTSWKAPFTGMFRVIAVGGGGAGGAGQAGVTSAIVGYGGGGAGGSTAVRHYFLTQGQSCSYAIGNGGAGGGGAGPNGGSTTFSDGTTILTAYGGGGGQNGVGANGVQVYAGSGGVGLSASSSNADYGSPGSSGEPGCFSGTGHMGGAGGCSILGQGGAARTGSGVGNAGAQYGGGGSGGSSNTPNTANNGGSGASGILIIEVIE
jgi:hypothetical protein